MLALPQYFEICALKSINDYKLQERVFAVPPQAQVTLICIRAYLRSMAPAKKSASAPQRSEWATIHAVYVALHQGHRLAPDVWTVTECNRVLSAATAAKPTSWRVIGITPAALKRLAGFDFKYRSREGFTRGHLRSRVATMREVLAPKRPMSQRQLATVWQKNDGKSWKVDEELRVVIRKKKITLE